MCAHVLGTADVQQGVTTCRQSDGVCTLKRLLPVSSRVYRPAVSQTVCVL